MKIRDTHYCLIFPARAYNFIIKIGFNKFAIS